MRDEAHAIDSVILLRIRCAQVRLCLNSCRRTLGRSAWRSGHYFCGSKCRQQYRIKEAKLYQMLSTPATRQAAHKRAAFASAAVASAAAPVTPAVTNTPTAVPTPPSPATRTLRKRKHDAVPHAVAPAPASDVTVAVPHARAAVRAVLTAARAKSPAPMHKRPRRGLAASFVPRAFTQHDRQALRHADDLDDATQTELLALCAEWRAYKEQAYQPDSRTSWYGLNNVKYQHGKHDPQTWQHDPARRAASLVERTEAVLRRILPCIPREYHLQICKLLSSDSRAPQQIQHTDLQEEHTQHMHSISVLLHLHPTRSAWVQRDQHLTGVELQYCPNVRETFHQFAADDGTVFAFRTDVLHYGPANLTKADRVLVYFLFTRKIVRGAGSNQTFFCQPLQNAPKAA